MFTIGDEKRMIAFSHHKEELAQVLFYDVEEGRVIKRVKNAEMFVHSFNGSAILFQADHVICGYAKQNA